MTTVQITFNDIIELQCIASKQHDRNVNECNDIVNCSLHNNFLDINDVTDAMNAGYNLHETRQTLNRFDNFLNVC